MTEIHENPHKAILYPGNGMPKEVCIKCATFAGVPITITEIRMGADAVKTKRQAILDAMASGDPLWSVDIYAKAGIPATSGNHTMRNLIREGLVKKVTHGLYQLVRTPEAP